MINSLIKSNRQREFYWDNLVIDGKNDLELWDEIPEKNYMEKFFMKIPIKED
jgi:hypothetical protein